MNAIEVVNTQNLSREEWLHHRRKGIGGSDVAALAGISRWKDAFTVFMEKTGQDIPRAPSEAMYWGTILENVVISEFKKRTGLKVDSCPALLQHPEISYLLANVDGIVTDEKGQQGVLEAKTAHAFSRSEWRGENLPSEYQLQLQHYLMVTGLSFGYIAVLIGGQEFLYTKIQRDNDMIRMILSMEGAFWQNHVLTAVPPDPTPHSKELLSLLYPGTTKEALSLPQEALTWIHQYQDHQHQEKTAAYHKEEAAVKLKALMKNHERAKRENYTVKWTRVSHKRFDLQAFQKEHPLLAQAYTKTGQYRRFSLHQTNE